MQDHIETLLVVDDEPVNLRMLERLLHHRYRVITANNAEKALEIFKQQEVSMVISDQCMPGMTGTELLCACKALKPDVVRMMITANTDTETYIEAIKNSGAVRVIHKPWEPEKVMQFIKEALEKQRVLFDSKKVIEKIDQALSQLKEASEGLNNLHHMSQ
jgi:response regulator RpfG family c-di-GMP phosphodiesterase